MALYFLDPSAMIQLYLDEPGSGQMVFLASPASGHQICASSLARLQLNSAIRTKLSRNEIKSEDAEQATRILEQHWPTLFLQQQVSDAVLDHANLLIQKHSCGSTEAIQLASCLAIARNNPVTFVTSNSNLAIAAIAEGLIVFDPNEAD